MPQVKGCIALCTSLRSKVCDEQGVGNYPLWKRYQQLSAIVDRHIPEQYRSFFAQPVENTGAEGATFVWYAEVASDVTPIRLSQLEEKEKNKYQQIKERTIAAYKTAIDECKTKGLRDDAEYIEKAMKYVGDYDDYFYCFNDKVVVVLWGMRPRATTDPQSCIINRHVQPNRTYIVRFDLGEHGESESVLELHKRESDKPIGEQQVPKIDAKEGYKFIGWDSNPVGYKVLHDIVFKAQYEELPIAPISPISPTPIEQKLEPVIDTPKTPIINTYTIRFEDENGNELSSCSINEGDVIPSSVIPPIPTKEHLKCSGWGDDLNQPVHSNRTYRLRYEPIPLSWWQRFKIWWHEKGCLKWLLRLLLFLLLIVLLLFLLRQCNGGGCSRRGGVPVSHYDGGNPFMPNDPSSGIGGGMGGQPINKTPGNGSNGGDSGKAYSPISPNDPGFGFLPTEPVKPVPIDDGDIIDDENGYRKIIDNRINVLLDDDSLTINQFAADFKAVYKEDKYQIIYADPLIKRLQLQVPAEERVQIKQELISRLPVQYTSDNVFIWDEVLMKSLFVPNDTKINECWYHNAIKTFSAWDITMGSEDIVVAVVDNGFALEHEDLAGKVVKPYNVYTKSTDVHESKEPHGSHVAGLAVATANNGCGIAGVAPNCKLMPIKVFDEHGHTSTMPVLDGILYAVYNGADVVNLSLGMCMEKQLPMSIQQQLIQNGFKEEERVWNKVFEIANRNNTAIVIAAGNENLLAGIDPMQRSQNTIVVAAVGKDHTPLYDKTGFSNFGSYTDVSAPGAKIISTVGNNRYMSMSGTSMAAPLVTGAVALVKSVNRTLSTAQIRDILQETGLEVNGNIGKLIQLDKALEKAQNTSANIIDSHPEPTKGGVQVLLEWDNYNALDFLCKDPNGDVVWFQNKTVPSGGILEIDMNAGNQYSSSPIENIYWPQNGAPKGEYKVGVLYYKRHDTQHATSDFKVMVRYGNTERSFKGTATTEKEVIEICDFIYE